MNAKIKALKEKIGDHRRAISNLTNDRASKVTELEALKDDFSDEGQTKYTNLKNEISTIDNKISRKQDEIKTVEKQIELEENNPSNSDDFQFMDPGSEPGGEEKEIGKFSFVKAFRQRLKGEPLTGLEKELHHEGEKEANQNGQKLEGNLHIPQKVLVARSRYNRIANDLTVDGGTGGDQGGVTVDTTLMSLIDILRAKLVFTDGPSGPGLGATFFSDLVGDVEFPRAIEDSNDPATKTETGAADEQSPTFGSLGLSPTRLPAFTEVTRKLLNQSSISVEVWVRNYLMYKLAKKMHIDIINAILGHASINVVVMGDPDGGAPTWAKIVEFETEISNDDADEPRMGWLTNPKVRGKLKTTEKFANTGEILWGKGNLVNEYAAFISTLVPNNLTKGAGTDLSAAIFANWASLYIGQWGGFDFLVNPYSRDTEGVVRINAWTFFDSGLRHPEAFAASSDIVTS